MRLPITVLRPGAAELPLDRGAVMRYLGYKPGVTRLAERHEALVDRGIGLAVAAAVPAVSLAYCGVEVTASAVTTRVPGLMWQSKSLARLLTGGVGVTLVAATVGDRVEELAARLFRDEEYALATVVDAAGSGLVHALGEYVRSYLLRSAGELALTALYGPGYGDWVIENQGALVAAAGGADVGVASNEACYLMPQKSLVGIIGWIAGSVKSVSGCQLCTMPDCAYRARASAGETGRLF
jgi:hypothetical protein